ncbi:hypothetical protein [Cytobacillus sp. IB215665]|uniref:hypothetical protein n=1 Tax=Cytobacillus sp. IB215665 TaxID=3097357 RepID=UPI002A182A84|nr:hypothetical protein [Cytobacillus sp. IB215665]MDX8367364.1 hypothetical protein [Cytobacillus sp. IB215665]
MNDETEEITKGLNELALEEDVEQEFTDGEKKDEETVVINHVDTKTNPSLENKENSKASDSAKEHASTNSAVHFMSLKEEEEVE